jgi:hypothetical protein
MANDEKLWWCVNCALEFDLEDEEIRVIRKESRTALISCQNRVHSLIATTFDKIRKRRGLENKALSVNPYNMTVKKDPPEQMLGDIELEGANEK